MYALAIMLLIIGVSLLIAECFFAGFGVCGIAGTISLLISSVMIILYVPFGIYVVLSQIAIIFVIIYLILAYIKKHQLNGKIILTETVGYEKNEIGDLEFFIGKEGVATTPLKPFGYVDFNGINIEVSSEGRFVPAGKRVRVVRIFESKVYVKEVSQ